MFIETAAAIVVSLVAAGSAAAEPRLAQRGGALDPAYLDKLRSSGGGRSRR